MGITTQTLMKERFVLQKSFNDMNSKITTIEQEVAQMKNNLNAVHGALQQVEKLIKFDAEYGKDDGTHAKEPVDKGGLDIKPKEEAQLLNEKNK
jgi:phage regulator Rha-like protein|tara:strand:- start:14335 stop:14616 length:282 start_codon:yes stop_codon:yes gene_type:complete